MRLSYIIRLTLALCLTLLSSCHKEQDDLFTSARISLESEGITIQQLDCTATFTNLNSHRESNSTTTQGNEIRATLLRGIYRISVQGTVTYTDPSGTVLSRRFRAQQDLIDLSPDGESKVSLTIYFV